MSTTELILLAIAAIIAIYILIRIAKTLFKIAIFAVALFVIYLIWTSGSADNLIESGLEKMFQGQTISQLENKYCADGRADKMRCECVIIPVHEDLKARFRPHELNDLEQNEKLMVDEMLKSFNNKKPEIKECMKEKQSRWIRAFNTIKRLFNAFSKEDGEKA